jgi:hypothetical protein
LKALWKNSLAGLMANLVPGIILQVIGLTIVLIYYFVDSARSVFVSIADLKQAYGYVYSGVATAIFGGLIPFVYLYGAKKVPVGRARSWAVFFVLYWMWRGVEVDALYRLQDWLFGNALNLKTVVTKVAVDQFVYCPLWSAPVTAVFYGWRDGGFTWDAFRSQFTRRLFTYEIPSVLLAIWLVWIPATSIIYSLPLLLQIPLFNLVLCFFVLLVSVLGESPIDQHPEYQ